ncbi:fibronectin type III-like domain-contianing protein [Microbacterium sp.]|uniref:fibronectin type III-like domain-contianing protein n=1 Tax=Microbacterium sp. TaxID=51671 RepID=UPI0025F86D2F|nr:fibronectin type III-like domain-contianing protein [Microbacterium sp.]
MQLYVATDAGPVRRPARELRSFAKISLEPGHTETVELTLGRRAFAYWDVELSQWVVPAGEYRIQVGENVSTIVAEHSVTLEGDVVVRALTMASGLTEEQAQQAEQNPDALKMVESMPMQQFLTFTNGAFPLEMLEQLMALSTDEPANA